MAERSAETVEAHVAAQFPARPGEEPTNGWDPGAGSKGWVARLEMVAVDGTRAEFEGVEEVEEGGEVGEVEEVEEVSMNRESSG